ncbi:MAG TPA: AAA family ATPase [Chloroflexota bacterium]|nr:AAA family ATPase [Chloroflexota bacterium]
MNRTLAQQGGDELDRQIDAALDRVGKFVGFWLRVVATLALIAGVFWLVLLSPLSDTIREPVLYLFLMLFQIAFAILFVIVQFAAIFWFLGRGRVYWIMPGETGVGFDDYKGNPEVLELATRIVTLLRGVRQFKQMGGEVHRGMLMVGPPGTGKSYLAQCIATEAGVPFAYASAPSFQNMFFGIGNVRVMMLYGKARKLARKYGACIIFIDEIDAIGGSRGSQMAGAPAGMLGGLFGGAGAGLLNELLLQMDPPPLDESWRARLLRRMGLRARPAERPAVLTIGATNLPEVLDQALLRPGRFDWKISIDPPDFDGRKAVIQYYLDKVSHDPAIPLDRLAMDMIGYTPVAIKYVINEAVVVAHFDGRNVIEYRDLLLATEMYETGLRQPIRSMRAEERRRIAYHEAGHAIALVKRMPRERLVQLTIIRHGGALGYMKPKPVEEIYGYSVDELLANVQVSLAGKAAEQVYLGTEFTGANSDLVTATMLGMGIIGIHGMNGSLYSVATFREPPDAKMKREIEKLLEDQFTKVKLLLAEYRPAADEIVERLMADGDLIGDEVIDIIGRFEEQKYGQRSPETTLQRTEERFLGSIAAPVNGISSPAVASPSSAW